MGDTVELATIQHTARSAARALVTRYGADVIVDVEDVVSIAGLGRTVADHIVTDESE